ncbi:MAG TPA: allophanate hydrolase [Burkholderiales bacterium]|jgi:allophanate hydrolase|nr:allophanate hydrolase [Burkholderiales bacterium]
MLGADDSLDLHALGARLRAGSVRPRDVVAGVLDRIAARGDDKVWIRLAPRGALQARAAALELIAPADLPLYGVPFAIKDNIDCAGEPTTAGCPEFAYTPDESAPVVQRLVHAGAILIGKTNLDQFATGLVGTRSPYGACASAFDARDIAGGSSSGSAVAVAAGLVSFALGTDTAGSGRVPAAFNNIVGLKPTRGLLSTRGVVPACRSLDCVSIFALTAGDAAAVLDVAAGFDPADPFSRLAAPARALPATLAACRVGVPRAEQLEFFGNRDAERLFHAAVEALVGQGARAVEIDFAPFLETARLLYGGPWVAERYVAIREFFDRRPDALFPVTREIIAGAAKFSAADCFVAGYRLQELRRQVEPVWQSVDVLVTPTAGTTYTIDEVNANPIRLNTNLGYYTNFMNLLDLAAVAVPAGFQADGRPFGITLAAPAFGDRALCALGAGVHGRLVQRLGATRATLPPPPPAAAPARAQLPVVRLAVCGAHMSGLPLNHQLTERGARLVRRCRTAPRYRLFALNAFSPPRPGLLRSDGDGHAIEVEVWALPTETVGSFVDAIPSPLGIGTVELEDGEHVRGFLCEAHAATGAEDVSDLGSWRTYVDQKKR